jgi:prepilin-type N-terminal cleavage/methylation domain-containing protein
MSFLIKSVVYAVSRSTHLDMEKGSDMAVTCSALSRDCSVVDCSGERRSTRRPRRGFTLVELLVVIAIIGILVAMLLPAVQAAREAARRSQCQNNCKNLGLSMMNYEGVYKKFPVAINTEPLDPSPQVARASDGTRLYNNWAIDILPFMEEQALYDTFHLVRADTGRLQTLTSANIPAAALGGSNKPANTNVIARSTELSLQLCPSDIGANNLFDAGAPNNAGDANNMWARGNYGYNVGLAMILDHHEQKIWNKTQLDAEGVPMTCGRGVGGADKSATMSQITDGTSHTVALFEIRVGLGPVDRRGVWAMQMVGSNLVSQHGANYAFGPNDCTPGSDDIKGNSAVVAEFGREYLAQECMLPYENENSWNVSAQIVTRSQHPGGIFATMCDGSVQFISDFVETGGQTNGLRCAETLFGAWQRLTCPDDGYVVTNDF